MMVYDTPCRMYFNAWTNDAQSDVVDFQDAQLISTNIKSKQEEVVMKDIFTQHKGKGLFKFTPKSGYTF